MGITGEVEIQMGGMSERPCIVDSTRIDAKAVEYDEQHRLGVIQVFNFHLRYPGRTRCCVRAIFNHQDMEQTSGLSPGQRFPAGYAYRLLYHLIRISPFIVVPAHDLDKIAIDHLRQGEVDYRSTRIFDHIGRHDLVFCDPEDALVSFALRLLFKKGIYLVRRRLPRGHKVDIGDGTDRYRHPDGKSVESSR